MAGPLMAVGRALLGSELTSNLQNAGYLPSIRGSGRSPGWGENVSLGRLLSESAAPMGRLIGLLPEERPNYNLPTDYYVGPQGQVLSSEGERMVTGQGVSGFQPENQYGSRGFEEPRYEPPMPWNYSLGDAANIPSQIPMGAPAQEFPPQRTYSFERDVGGLDTGSGSVPLPSAPMPEGPYWNRTMPAQYELGRQELPLQNLSMGLPSAMSSVAPPVESLDQELERLAARYAQQAPSAEEEETASVWWPRAPQVDPRFLQQQQAQQR